MRINLRSLLIFFLVVYGIARTLPSTTTSPPHQVFGYLTPQQFLHQIPSPRKE